MPEFVRLNPAYVNKIWGGSRLGKPNAAGEGIGEAWILSAIPGNESIVATGAHAGETFLDYLGHTNPGSNASVMNAFPTLIKFIDAASPLSIQVHPDDIYAHAHGMPYGKTEMWIILAADPGSFLYLGLKEKMKPQEFADAIAKNTIEEKFNKVPVKPGEVYFIKAGLLHAIGGGILLAEVQQSSDTTYRVYDFGRLGADGKPRELHIKQAEEVASLEPPTAFGPLEKVVTLPSGTRQLLGKDSCFATERFILSAKTCIPVTSKSYVAIIMLEGSAQLLLDRQKEIASVGQTFFIPAQDANIIVTPKGRTCTFLRVTIPDADGSIE
jgi:mannose-6-phosphate isomerase